MSDAELRGTERGKSSGPKRSETTNGDLRSGDLTRVVSEDTTVDRAAVISRWKFAQEDFSPDTAPEVPSKIEKWTDLTGDFPEERSVRKIDGGANRSTLQTEDGRKYALVDWHTTEDPPFLYLMVIDSEDPDERRWTSLGPVQKIQRYGPEPMYRMSGYKWARKRARDAKVLNLAADGEFSVELDPDHLRCLANRREKSEPSDLSTRDITALNTVYRTAREHVKQTGEPLLTDSKDEDLSRMDREFNRGRYYALFPDGSGGQIEKKPPNSGLPSEDIPPWEQDMDSDPDFTPLGQTND